MASSFSFGAVDLPYTLPNDFGGSSWVPPAVAKLTGYMCNAGAVAVSIFPSIMGFGIGVYALVFAIPEQLVRKMDQVLAMAIKSGRRKHGSVFVLNADLGFPLTVMVTALAVGVLQQAAPSVLWVLVLSWFLFWFALVSVVEIIGVLFQLGDHAVLERLHPEKED